MLFSSSSFLYALFMCFIAAVRIPHRVQTTSQLSHVATTRQYHACHCSLATPSCRNVFSLPFFPSNTLARTLCHEPSKPAATEARAFFWDKYLYKPKRREETAVCPYIRQSLPKHRRMKYERQEVGRLSWQPIVCGMVSSHKRDHVQTACTTVCPEITSWLL